MPTNSTTSALAFTGSGVMILVAVGAALIIGGLALMALDRRRQF